MPLSRASEALEEIRRGRAVVLLDDDDPEAEGDLVVAAERITPDWVNFMALHCRGVVSLALTEARARELELPMMVPAASPVDAAFTVSIEARRGVTTGISAADRATTILTAVAPGTTSGDLCRPGHVFPVVARAGGVLVRAGRTEGAVDLADSAGLQPAAATCRILSEDGSVARRSELEDFARKHQLRFVSVADLIAFRRAKEKLVRRYVELDLIFRYGEFHTIVYRSEIDDTEHFAYTKGDVSNGEPVLVRMQTAIPADSLNPDLGLPSVLAAPMTQIAAEGRGALVFVGQPGGGERIGDTLRRHLAGPTGAAAMPRDDADRLRDYGIGAQILVDLGIRRLRLLTSRPRRIVGLEAFDLQVEEIVPMVRIGNPFAPAR